MIIEYLITMIMIMKIIVMMIIGKIIIIIILQVDQIIHIKKIILKILQIKSKK